MAQDEEGGAAEKIRDRMNEFIQRRLQMSKEEADKFSPIFTRYFQEWKTTLKENRQDKIMLQKKVAELKLQYRDRFKDILGEKRSNDVFRHQDIFIQELKEIRRESDLPRRQPRRTKMLLQ